MRRKQQEAVDGLAVVIVSIPRNEDTVPVLSIAIRGQLNKVGAAGTVSSGPALNFADINLSARLSTAPGHGQWD